MDTDLIPPKNKSALQRTAVRLALTLVLFSLPVILFAGIADEVADKEDFAFDAYILHALHSVQSGPLTSLAIIITELGGVITIALLSLVIGGLLFHFKRYAQSFLILAGVGGAAALNFVLKLIFQRERPDFWAHLVVEHDYSFPSGHAMASSALAFTIIWALWNTRWRFAAILLGGLYVVTVGLSRMYLGVHFPSDIIAGWCVSFAWVLLVKKIIGRVFRNRPIIMNPASDKVSDSSL